MAQLINNIKPEIFNQRLDGTFGWFFTNTSNEINYLLTVIRPENLSLLKIASEILDYKSASFEEIIQRDIDYKRVREEIITYVTQSKPVPIFFPPILVALLPIENNQIIPGYDSPADEKEETPALFFKTWDDKFRIELNHLKDQTGCVYKSKNFGNLNLLSYASTIAYNPQKVHLVVIDGQHRFVALKEIFSKNETRHSISNIQIPICVLFPPNAVKTNENENIVAGFREIFVTVNQKAKAVSGHFLTLLNDKSISAMAVRILGDKWKNLPENTANTYYLHFLEWNNRDGNKDFQRQSTYSITTVSILADALKKYIFNKFLNEFLHIENNEFESNNPITEDNYSFVQAEFIKEKIRQRVYPGLNALLTKPIPYSVHIDNFNKAVLRLEELIKNNVGGAKEFKDNYLTNFMMSKIDKGKFNLHPATNTVAEEFEKRACASLEHKFFFTNIFQNAIIAVWAELWKELFAINILINPLDVAEALIAAGNRFSFDPKYKFWSSEKNYLQLVLYQGIRLLVTESSKKACKRLIISTLKNSKILDEFVNTLNINSHKEKIAETITKLANKSFQEFCKDYVKSLQNDCRKNWLLWAISTEDRNFLTLRVSSQEKSNKEEFNSKIDQLARIRFEEGISELNAFLQLA